MKIAVCVKAVPDAASGRHIDPATNRLDRSGELTISEWDTYAIEEALRLKEAAGDGEIVVVSMGPERALDALRKALAMGADRAVLVSDVALEGADLLGTAKALAGALERESAELVLFGQQSADGGGACLWAAVAERLRAPGRLAGQRASGRRRLDDGQAADRVRLRHDSRAAAGGDRGRRLDQHAALPVAEGDHGREEEAPGDARGGGVGGAESAATTVVALNAPPARGEARKIEDDGSGAEQILEFLVEKRLV